MKPLSEAEYLVEILNDPLSHQHRRDLADLLIGSGDPRGEVFRCLHRLIAWGPEMRDERHEIEQRLCELLESGVSPVGPFVINTIGMKLAMIVPGEFVMGSPDNEFGHREDEAQDFVQLTRPFLLGVTTVTQGQYQELMHENPSREYGPDEQDPTDASSQLVPVDQVTWGDAVEFCRRLSELAGERAERRTYQLPTEAQWEYACRAGTSGPFHFGLTLPTHLANFNGNKPYVFAERGEFLKRSVAVGTYLPNAFGLLDVHGNVWEWCRDWYQPRLPGGTDPEVTTPSDVRVVRGGGWNDPADSCRSATRSSCNPERCDWRLGFRVMVPL